MTKTVIASIAHLMLLVGTATSLLMLFKGPSESHKGSSAPKALKDRRAAVKAAKRKFNRITND